MQLLNQQVYSFLIILLIFNTSLMLSLPNHACRYELNKFLIAKAEAAGTKFYFGHSLDAKETSFDDNAVNGGGAVGSTLVFDVTVDGVTSKKYVNCACPVLACDGGGSRARFAMKEQGFTQYTETLLGSDT